MFSFSFTFLLVFPPVFFLFNYQCDTYVCCVCVYYIFLIKIKKHFMVILFPCNNVVRHTVMSAICLAVRQLNTF